MNRRRHAVILLTALQPIACGAAESGLSELMQTLARVPSAHARFTETHHLSVLQTPMVLSGRLSYARPDQLEKHVLAPYDERTLIRGTTVTVENRTRGTMRILSLASAPGAHALVEALRATLAGDLPALERHYKVQFAGARNDWALTLEPREPGLAALLSRIRIAGSGARLTRIEAFESGEDRWTMTISEDKP